MISEQEGPPGRTESTVISNRLLHEIDIDEDPPGPWPPEPDSDPEPMPEPPLA